MGLKIPDMRRQPSPYWEKKNLENILPQFNETLSSGNYLSKTDKQKDRVESVWN